MSLQPCLAPPVLPQESMSRGEFDNLSGAGQPLPTRPPDYNPYLDFTTHKMNQILVETGFSPEWVELQKEIRNQTEAMRGELRKCRWVVIFNNSTFNLVSK